MHDVNVFRFFTTFRMTHLIFKEYDEKFKTLGPRIVDGNSVYNPKGAESHDSSRFAGLEAHYYSDHF